MTRRLNDMDLAVLDIKLFANQQMGIFESRYDHLDEPTCNC